MHTFLFRHVLLIVRLEESAKGCFIATARVGLRWTDFMNITFHSTTIPAGSVVKRRPFSPSIPQINVQTPNGRRPPRCVYLRSMHGKMQTIAAGDPRSSLYTLQRESHRRTCDNSELPRAPWLDPKKQKYDIDELSCIGTQASKQKGDVFVDFQQFFDCARILKLCSCFLLNSEDNTLVTHYGDHRISLFEKRQQGNALFSQLPWHTQLERDDHQVRRQLMLDRNYALLCLSIKNTS